MNAAKELGRIIGDLSRQQQKLQENVYPDDPDAELQLIQTEQLSVTQAGSVFGLELDSTSFVLDHPVLGELDSATLELDGGYAQTGGTPTFPAVFPWTFTPTTDSRTLLQTFN